MILGPVEAARCGSDGLTMRSKSDMKPSMPLAKSVPPLEQSLVAHPPCPPVAECHWVSLVQAGRACLAHVAAGVGERVCCRFDDKPL